MVELKRELNSDVCIIQARKSTNSFLIEKLPKYKALNNYLKREAIFL